MVEIGPMSGSLRAKKSIRLIPMLDQMWIGLPFFLLLLKSFVFPLPLLDFWWHLKMGQVILDRGLIPRSDLFSFTASGKLFIVQNWLAEIFFYAAYRAGGFPLLIFFNSLLLVASLVPVYLLCRRETKNLWPSVFAASIIAVCITCNMRPQVFSFLFFAIFYWLLSSFRTKEKYLLCSLPLLMVLWVNIHGAFVLGLVLIAVFLASEMIKTILNCSFSDSQNRRKILKLALVLLLCSIATLANPETYSVYNYIRTVVNDPSSRQFVLEWQPPTISSIQGVIQFYLPFFLTTVVLIMSERRPSFTELMLFVGFSVFGMIAVRNSVWFLLISGPILARHLPSIRWSLLSYPRLVRLTPSSSTLIGTNIGGRRQYPFLNVIISMMAIGLIGIQSPWTQYYFRKGSLVDPKTPVGAMDFISMHPLDGNIFHPQIYGDYLIWRLWPRQRAFFDGRVHLYGESFVRSYQRIYDDSHWEEILSGYDIRYLLLSKQEEKTDNKGLIDKVRLSRHWKVLYEDNASILWEKVMADSA